MGEEIVDRSEGSGERLLGLLLDRARLMPPQLIAPLIAEEVARVGGRDVSILLQDYAQELLVPLPGRKLHVGRPEPMADSPAGRAFLHAEVVEVPQAGGVRMYLPLLDGSDQVGVMALTLDAVTDDDRRLLRRLAGLVADMLVTKNSYTDQFFLARRRRWPTRPREDVVEAGPAPELRVYAPVTIDHGLGSGNRRVSARIHIPLA
ncbi:hypothetical protein AB0J35_40895 [Nonomuraea angiospora]|uniref:hypothetical protein n=1 Tax=Nonomuraea angiospora TaxID=46172 RepID=UPI003445FEB6